MVNKRLPRPRDPIQIGKLIGDIATGQVSILLTMGKTRQRRPWGARAALAELRP